LNEKVENRGKEVMVEMEQRLLEKQAEIDK
jgi:hypothetical protein